MLLRKGLSPYEYIDDWEKFIELSLLKNEDCYRHLSMEDITDADYKHADYKHGKRVCRDFKITNLGEFHDLYV